MDTHQIEAETINMVFVDPVFHALDYKAAHHRLVTGRLVATARAIGVFAVGCFAIIIIRISTLEIGVLNVVSMVIHHVEDHTDASIMKGFHHLLELANANLRLVGIRRVATFRHVVVHGVVAPVVFVVGEACFIHRTIVVTG